MGGLYDCPADLHTRVRGASIKGFLADDEAEALYGYCGRVSKLGPALEVGSYCGKSTIYLGLACQRAGAVLYAVDHHSGSEEHQLGEEYYDADLYDVQRACVDTLPRFRRALSVFKLENAVVPILSSSQLVAKAWATPLSLVFVDGGHSHQQSMHDCTVWAKHVVPGGLLLVHDIFESPEDGGQGPYLGVQAVLATGAFEVVCKVRSMVILRRL